MIIFPDEKTLNQLDPSWNIFIRKIQTALENIPDDTAAFCDFSYTFSGNERNESFRLCISSKKGNDDIEVILEKCAVYIFIGGWHDDFNYNPQSPEIETLSNHIAELISGLILGKFKIVQFMVGGKPFKWQLFENVDGIWIFRSSTSTLIYNYFGKRSSRSGDIHDKFCQWNLENSQIKFPFT